MAERDDRNAAERTATGLRGLLVKRGLREGDRLPTERELSELLEVSRPTIREAIGVLSADGVLGARQGSGTFVRSVDLLETMQMRLTLEPLAAELSATRRSPAEARMLGSMSETLAGQLDDPASFAATDLAFHELIATSSSQSLLIDAIARLTTLMMLSRRVTSDRRSLREATLGHISTIAEAVRSHDAELAREEMTVHLREVETSLTAG